MHLANIYPALVTELETWRQLPIADLVGRVGAAPTVHAAEIDGEAVTWEVVASWVDAKQLAIRVQATVFGPSTWRVQRAEEAITVHVSTS